MARGDVLLGAKDRGRKPHCIAGYFTVRVKFADSYNHAVTSNIHNLDDLIELVNQLLIAETLAEFEEKVIGYLPKDEEKK